MKRNSATRLLCLLTEEELRRFSKFLRSPYFNNTPILIKLFEQLRRWHPDYEEKRIHPPKIWKKLEPDKDFSAQKYWWLNFKLRTLVEKFMIVEEVMSNEGESKKHLIKSYGRRNVHGLFEKETKSFLAKISKMPFQNLHTYSSSLWLKYDYFFNPQTDKYGGALYSVEDVMDELDRFYLLAKLQFASEIKNRERIFSKKVPIDLLEESILTSRKYVPENPAFLMYRNVLDLYDPTKSDKAFRAGLDLLSKQFALVSKDDQNEIILNLQNYAIRQVNKGNKDYTPELFQLYKLGLKLGLLIDNGKLSQPTYQNIVQVGCQLKEFKWTEEFINSFDIYLEEKYRMDNKLLSLGILYFEKKEFDKSLDFISQRDFGSILHQVTTRLIISKIWFEKFLKDPNLFDLLVSKLESDEKFFRRMMTVSQQRKEAHLNFVLALKLFSNFVCQNKSKKEIRKKMSKYLGERVIMSSKKWLLEKIEQPYRKSSGK